MQSLLCNRRKKKILYNLFRGMKKLWQVNSYDILYVNMLSAANITR